MILSHRALDLSLTNPEPLKNYSTLNSKRIGNGNQSVTIHSLFPVRGLDNHLVTIRKVLEKFLPTFCP